MSDSPPVVQYWHEREIPPYIQKRMRSFARSNPGRPHLVFNARTAEEFIARHFGEQNVAAFRACGPAAMQADYLRYCAIFQLGGAWADAGLTCVRSLDSLSPPSQAGTLFRWPAPYGGLVLMSALFAFRLPEHPFLGLAIEVSTKLIEMRRKGRVNEITGPVTLTAIYRLGLAGTTEALLEEMRKDGQTPSRHFSYVEEVSGAIGDCARAVEASHGIVVLRPGAYKKWALGSGGDLPHRASENYWPKLGTDIYTESSRIE